MSARAACEIELDDGVLVIKRIHVVYNLTAPDAVQEIIDRVHGVHKEGCPVYRSLLPHAVLASAMTSPFSFQTSIRSPSMTNCFEELILGRRTVNGTA